MIRLSCTARIKRGTFLGLMISSFPPHLFTGRPGRSSNARVGRAPSECARSASRRTARLPRVSLPRPRVARARRAVGYPAPSPLFSEKPAFGAAPGQVFEAGLRCREVSAELPHVLRILRRPMPAQSQPDQPESTVEAFEGDFSIFNVPAKLDVRYSSDMHGS